MTQLMTTTAFIVPRPPSPQTSTPPPSHTRVYAYSPKTGAAMAQISEPSCQAQISRSTSLASALRQPAERHRRSQRTWLGFELGLAARASG